MQKMQMFFYRPDAWRPRIARILSGDLKDQVYAIWQPITDNVSRSKHPDRPQPQTTASDYGL